MEDASYTQTLRDLDEQRGVFDIDDPLCARLGDVECKPEDVYVGFANMYKTGGYEKVHKAIQLELANSMRVQFAAFIADDSDLESMMELELSDQSNHFVVRFRLRKHKLPELSTGESSPFMENHTTQVFVQRELAFFVRPDV